MSQKITRKAPNARKVAAAQGTARKVRSAKAKTGSALDRTLAALPFSEETLHRIVLCIILGGALVLAWMMATLAGVPAIAGRKIAIFAGDAGFEVRRVDVRGVKHLNELKVYEIVLAERDRAMPLVDIGALRSELMEIPWIEDARVSRQLPDTLVVDIVERTPHAVLRKADRLVLIDAAGNELEGVSAARAKGQLVLGGDGAGKQVAGLNALLEAAPALKPQVSEAEWVGNRRWNLTFQTGQVLALPQGDKLAEVALLNFARLDGTNRLLGGRVAVFDFRRSDRIYLRIPGRAQQEANDVAEARTAAANAAAKQAAAATTATKQAKSEEQN
jgi:cell division protein FtsQ